MMGEQPLDGLTAFVAFLERYDTYAKELSRKLNELEQELASELRKTNSKKNWESIKTDLKILEADAIRTQESLKKETRDFKIYLEKPLNNALPFLELLIEKVLDIQDQLRKISADSSPRYDVLQDAGSLAAAKRKVLEAGHGALLEVTQVYERVKREFEKFISDANSFYDSQVSGKG